MEAETENNMRTTFWKALSINLIYVLIFVTGFGGYSYLNADGTALIGANAYLSSIEAQRTEIVTGTLWSVLIIGSIAMFSFAMSKRTARHSCTSK